MNELTSGRQYWQEQITTALGNIPLADLNRAEKDFKEHRGAKFELVIEQEGSFSTATMRVHWKDKDQN